jgi:hypothetical protein
MLRLLGVRIPPVIGVPLGIAVLATGLVTGRFLACVAGGLVLVTSLVGAGHREDDAPRR